MGRDNQARIRQARQLNRKQGRRSPLDRVLIVCEGSKTEPAYFKEIRAHYRLQTASVAVQPCEYGTSPLQVVEYARELFLNGAGHRRVQARAFEHVYAVFDRDDHFHYHEALDRSRALDGTLRNDLKKKAGFHAVASVPCFELWLLLHFSEVSWEYSLHRREVVRRLRSYLQDYEKGSGGHFGQTIDFLEDAFRRSELLVYKNNAYDGKLPFTEVGKLVAVLQKLGKK